jgi:hypothetical protein
MPAASSIRRRIFRLNEGRVSFSLNAANSMIAAGCLFIVAFALFVIGYRSGSSAAPTDGKSSSAALERVAQIRGGGDQSSGMALEMAKPTADAQSAPGSAERAGPALTLVRRGQEPTSRAEPDSKDFPVIEPGGPSDPRVSGLTYIVIEYFPKSAKHDALAECRHVARFLKENGVGTFILAGQEGYQLVTAKGFKFKAERQARLDHKLRIRKLAKEYKPLDRPYMFMSFEKTHYPDR